jgi:hypothetical protein
MKRFLVFGLLAVSMGRALALDSGVCQFDKATLTFRGDAREQAGCLLRPVAKWGKPGAAPAALPAVLADRVGQPVGKLKPQLKRYLAERNIPEASIGGSLGAALSRTATGSAAPQPARYFVLHDTSAPWLGDAAAFPANDAPALNRLEQYGGPEARAHVFVNRVGATLAGHDFSVPWRATKLESKVVGTDSRGLFLHIELLQPRRRDPSGPPGNDAIAPQPGFTAAQYEKLALLYAAASARGDAWMIPAFHAVIDDTIPQAHDDPQNFDLDAFGKALSALLDALPAFPG